METWWSLCGLLESHLLCNLTQHQEHSSNFKPPTGTCNEIRFRSKFSTDKIFRQFSPAERSCLRLHEACRATLFAHEAQFFTKGFNYLEPETTISKWLFQLDDSKSLHRKWLFHQTSIYKWLFGVQLWFNGKSQLAPEGVDFVDPKLPIIRVGRSKWRRGLQLRIEYGRRRFCHQVLPHAPLLVWWVFFFT